MRRGERYLIHTCDACLLFVSKKDQVRGSGENHAFLNQIKVEGRRDWYISSKQTKTSHKLVVYCNRMEFRADMIPNSLFLMHLCLSLVPSL